MLKIGNWKRIKLWKVFVKRRIRKRIYWLKKVKIELEIELEK